jgi:hypothetical protein
VTGGLTALVEVVDPDDVVLAHLLGLAEGHVGVGDGDHGGLVVLGEGVPARREKEESNGLFWLLITVWFINGT